MWELEDSLAENRPGLSHSEILKMPFYEFSIKLDIITRKLEERKKEEEKSTKEQKSSMSKYTPNITPIKPPQIKLPSGLK
jgi:hypothetical protein